MWRDAAEQVARGLDDGSPKGWCALLDHLFGSQPALDDRGRAGDTPIAGCLSLHDAILPPLLRSRLLGKDKARLRAMLALVKPGVAIDPRSGRAKADHLRFEEVARRGAVLKAEAAIALTGNGDTDKALVALAFAATRLVERIGGNRRRGSPGTALKR
jgi:CRISPR-associated protein Csx10